MNTTRFSVMHAIPVLNNNNNATEMADWNGLQLITMANIGAYFKQTCLQAAYKHTVSSNSCFQKEVEPS